jgi:hypothetical protein
MKNTHTLNLLLLFFKFTFSWLTAFPWPFPKKIEALKVVILIERLFEVEFERVLFLLNSLYKSLYVIG